MAEYTVILADLATGAVRDRFRLEGLTYSRTLNGSGAFSGNLVYADRRILATNPIGSTTLAKTVAYVERNEARIVWAGIVWQRRRNSQAQGRAELRGSELWSYLGRRQITHTLVFTAKDQLSIARDLIAYAQGQSMTVVAGAPITYAKPGGSIGVTVGAELSGVTRDVTYEASQHLDVSEAIGQMANLDGGFDFSIDPEFSAGLGSSITRPFVLGYPRRGRPVTQTGLSWEYGQNMTDYDWLEDATEIATTSYALGQGEGADMLQSSASAQYIIDAGYPLLERSRSYKDVSVQATLDAHARADSAADGVTAVVLPTITVDGGMDPQVGAYVCGDETYVVINDENFPSQGPGGADLSINTSMRIHGYEVAVDQAGREVVQVTLGPVLA